MTAQTILPANTLSSGDFVTNSARFESAQLLRTNSGSTATNVDKYTVSVWLKRSKLGVDSNIIADVDGSGNYYQIYFKSDDTLRWQETGNGDYITTRKFRDVGAWYHIVCRYDSSLGTAGDRMRIYINGVEETSFGTSNNPDQNDDGHFAETNSAKCIADNDADGREFFGYMCEFMGVDGQSLAPTSFGEFDSDSGIWTPIDISGITQGVHGFYLQFQDSSDLGTATLGADWAPTALAATDQSTDTCQNNFCTWNPIANYTNSVAFSEGNLVAMSGTNDRWDSGRATMGFSKGKWYFECLFVAGVSTQYIGVTDESAKFNTANAHDEDGVTVFYNNSGGEIRKDGTATTADYGTFSSSEVAGIAIDADNFTISVYKGGSLIVDAYDLSTTRTGFLFPFTTNLNNGDGVKVNFGSPHYSESGGNTDANGYGNFNQSVPSGYFAINTKNLAEHG
jgi:hypothetical protein